MSLCNDEKNFIGKRRVERGDAKGGGEIDAGPAVANVGKDAGGLADRRSARLYAEHVRELREIPARFKTIGNNKISTGTVDKILPVEK